MPATLRLSASLKILLEMNDEITVQAGSSVRETISLHGIKPELVALVSVNGVMQTKDYIIQEKDEIRLLAVVGGG